MQAIPAGTREAFDLVLVLRIGLFLAQTSTCCEGTVKEWRRFCVGGLGHLMPTSAH